MTDLVKVEYDSRALLAARRGFDAVSKSAAAARLGIDGFARKASEKKRATDQLATSLSRTEAASLALGAEMRKALALNDELRPPPNEEEALRAVTEVDAMLAKGRKANEAYAALMGKVIEQTTDQITKAFAEVLKSGDVSMGALSKLVKATFAEIAANAIIRPIVQPLVVSAVTAVPGLFGLAPPPPAQAASGSVPSPATTLSGLSSANGVMGDPLGLAKFTTSFTALMKEPLFGATAGAGAEAMGFAAITTGEVVTTVALVAAGLLMSGVFEDEDYPYAIGQVTAQNGQAVVSYNSALDGGDSAAAEAAAQKIADSVNQLVGSHGGAIVAFDTAYGYSADRPGSALAEGFFGGAGGSFADGATYEGLDAEDAATKAILFGIETGVYEGLDPLIEGVFRIATSFSDLESLDEAVDFAASWESITEAWLAGYTDWEKAIRGQGATAGAAVAATISDYLDKSAIIFPLEPPDTFTNQANILSVVSEDLTTGLVTLKDASGQTYTALRSLESGLIDMTMVGVTEFGFEGGEFGRGYYSETTGASGPTTGYYDSASGDFSLEPPPPPQTVTRIVETVLTPIQDTVLNFAGTIGPVFTAFGTEYVLASQDAETGSAIFVDAMGAVVQASFDAATGIYSVQDSFEEVTTGVGANLDNYTKSIQAASAAIGHLVAGEYKQPELTEMESTVEYATGYYNTLAVDLTDDVQEIFNSGLASEDWTRQLDEKKGDVAALVAEWMEAGLNNAIAALATEFDSSIKGQITAMVDPSAAALAELDAEFAILRRDAAAVGGDLVALEQLYGLKRNAVLDEANQRMLASLEEASQSMLAFFEETLAGIHEASDAVARAMRAAGQGAEADLVAFDAAAAHEMGSAMAAGRDEDSLKLLELTLDAERAALKAQGEQAALIEAIDAQMRVYEENTAATTELIGTMDHMAEELRGAAASMKIDPNLSPYSPERILKETRTQFDAAQAAALAGDMDTAALLPGLGQQRVEAAQRYFGSSNDDDFKIVRGALEDVALFAEEQADIGRALIEEGLDQLAALQLLRSEVSVGVQRQVDAINGVSVDIKSLSDQFEASITALAAAQVTLAGSISKTDATIPWNDPVMKAVFSAKTEVTEFDDGLMSVPGVSADRYTSLAYALGHQWGEWGEGQINDRRKVDQKFAADLDRAAAMYLAAKEFDLVGTFGFQSGGLIPGFASGGMVGNGLWNVDSVLARYGTGSAIALAGGEFVTRAPSVTAETLPVLSYINDNGAPPGPVWSGTPVGGEMAGEIRALRQELSELRKENSALLRQQIDLEAASGEATVRGLGAVRQSIDGNAAQRQLEQAA